MRARQRPRQAAQLAVPEWAEQPRAQPVERLAAAPHGSFGRDAGYRPSGYDATKGFGFVAPLEGGKGTCLVHASALQRAGITQLAEGQTILDGRRAGNQGSRGVRDPD